MDNLEGAVLRSGRTLGAGDTPARLPKVESNPEVSPAIHEVELLNLPNTEPHSDCLRAHVSASGVIGQTMAELRQAACSLPQVHQESQTDQDGVMYIKEVAYFTDGTVYEVTVERRNGEISSSEFS